MTHAVSSEGVLPVSKLTGKDFKGTNSLSELNSVMEIQITNSSALFESLIPNSYQLPDI